jgi:hypothetical protein
MSPRFAAASSPREYRTPGLLFWKTYHQAVREHIQKSILD